MRDSVRKAYYPAYYHGNQYLPLTAAAPGACNAKHLQPPAGAAVSGNLVFYAKPTMQKKGGIRNGHRPFSA